MNIIDISWPLSAETTAYKGKKSINFQITKQFETDRVRESLITLSSHSGTHVDAPAHFLEHGETIDQISLNSLCGPCTVIDMTQIEECITEQDIQSIAFQENSIVLFKTKNSFISPTHAFNPAFIYINASAAHYLAHKKIKAVGIDYLGIERNQSAHETHITLLKNNIVIIEGLRLQSVPPGSYQLICLPLAVQGLDGAPARAVLLSF